MLKADGGPMHGSRAINPVDEDTVRAALRSILWIVCPALFGLALVASRIDHPNAVPDLQQPRARTQR